MRVEAIIQKEDNFTWYEASSHRPAAFVWVILEGDMETMIAAWYSEGKFYDTRGQQIKENKIHLWMPGEERTAAMEIEQEVTLVGTE